MKEIPVSQGEDKKAVEYVYVPVEVNEPPDLLHYVNDRLILLDDYYDVLKVVPVGMLTEWDAIKGNASYWLKKSKLPLSSLAPKTALSDIQIENLAEREARLHFSPIFNRDAFTACMACYKAGYKENHVPEVKDNHLADVASHSCTSGNPNQQ